MRYAMNDKIGKTIHGVTIVSRKVIRPKAEVGAATSDQKKDVQHAAQQVMHTHRKVLEALRDR